MLKKLEEYTSDWTITCPNYYIIIGSCSPYDNLFLEYRKNSDYFPQKLIKYVESNSCRKYILREDDIDIDIKMFNEIFEEIFMKWFDSKKVLRNNIFCVRHSRLDCYSIYKIIKFIFGACNCVNMRETCKIGSVSPLVSINELIDKYVHAKNAVNKSRVFIDAV